MKNLGVSMGIDGAKLKLSDELVKAFEEHYALYSQIQKQHINASNEQER